MSDRNDRFHIFKKLGLAACAVAVVLGGGELALRGVGYRGRMLDPYESFVLHRPLFERAGNVYQTRPERAPFFHLQTFAADPPPNAMRVFVFGGSVTYGYALDRPREQSYCGKLEAALTDLFPDRAVEVINVGGICYASYRLLGLVEECLTYRPSFFIVMSGHNEFLEPRHYGPLFAGRRTVPGWQRFRLVQFAQDLGGRAEPGTAPARTEPVLASEYIGEEYIVRGEDERKQTLEHYAWNLEHMAAACSRSGVPLALCTLPSNLRDWAPFQSEAGKGADLDRLKLELQGIVDAMNTQDLAVAAARARTAVVAAPNVAVFHYLLARCLDAQGRPTEARVAYVAARDLDAFPHRTPSAFNAEVRRVAKAEDVLLFDAEQRFAAAARDGIPGNDLFLDQCHPNETGHALLARGLADLIYAKRDIFPPRHTP